MLTKVCRGLLTTRSVTVTQVKTKIWSKDYVEPVVSVKELENVKANDPDRLELLKYSKILPLNPFKYNNEFYDEFVHKLIGRVTRKGVRQRADKLIKETLFLIKKDRIEKCRLLDPCEREKFERNPIVIMKEAWNNIKPILKVTAVSRGGSKYLSPVPVLEKEKDKIVYKWVREVIEHRSRPRPEKFPQVFSREILLAYKNEGKLIKKKLDLYKLCEANKAYVNCIYMKTK